MNDTPANINAQFEDMLMKKSPQERLCMACSMFDAAKQIVTSSILESFPAISLVDFRKKIFLRFYGEDFNEIEKQKILNALG